MEKKKISDIAANRMGDIRQYGSIAKTAEQYNLEIIKYVFEKYFKPKIKQYIKKQNDSEKDSWYLTQKEFDEQTLIQFEKFIKESLDKKLIKKVKLKNFKVTIKK